MGIQIQSVYKEVRAGFLLQKVKILKGVSFDIPTGKTIGMLGPNGAGKTSLIHLIVGIKFPTSGQILVDGDPAMHSNAKRKMGYLPERPYFYDHLTGSQLLFYLGRFHGIEKNELKNRITKVLEKIKMKHAADLELRKFSKGMLQRIGIAQSILHDPKYVVLDEPMSGLDPVGRKEIKSLIRELAENQKTVLFSSHLVGDIEDLCDEVMVIKEGNLIEAGPITPLLEKQSEKATVRIQATKEQISRISKKYHAESMIDQYWQIEIKSSIELQDFLKLAIQDGVEIKNIERARSSLEDYFD